MTVAEFRAVIKDARAMATSLESVPDDEDATSIAYALREWARFTESWVNTKAEEEGE